MFEGLQIALSGIRAGQVGMDTAANNVANATTPGYTRQRADLGTMPPWQRNFGEIGMGVDVLAVNRLREGHLDTRVRSTGATASYTTARASMLQQAEELSGEPGNGIQQALLGLFDSFDELALDPADPAIRDAVVRALDSLAGTVRATAAGWTTLADEATQQIDLSLNEANQLLANVDELNRAISTSSTPLNAAMDERDLLIDQLSQIVGVTTEPQADGTVHVLLDGERIVQTPALPSVRTLSYDPTTGVTVSSPATQVSAGGEVGGLHLAATNDLPSLRAKLDQFALDLRDAVNAVNAAGSAADDPGGASWTDGGPPLLAATGADDIALAAGIDGFDIATAGLGNHALHDATNAQRFGTLRDQDPPGLGSPPLASRLRTLVIGMGDATKIAAAAASTHNGLHSGAVSAREAAHGVNLDEEMVSLLQHQRGLEAASRAMTALDEALDVLINRTGIVGR